VKNARENTSYRYVRKCRSDTKQLIPKYTYESGASINFPKKFNQWWKKHYIYPSSLVNDVDVKVATKSNPTLERFLVHKKPPREMLVGMKP
jgi:hypothetical protein